MKTHRFLGILLVTCMAFIACNFNDDDSHAETTQTFTGYIDSLVFTNPADTAYGKLITQAMVRDSLAGVPFSHYVSMSGTTTGYVNIVCNAQGVEHYKAIIKRHNMSQVRKYLYSIDSIRTRYGSEADIPLNEYKAYLSLYTSNGYNPFAVYKDTIIIK